MTTTARLHRLSVVLLVAVLVVVAGLAMALRANAAEVTEPTADAVVVRVTPERVWSSTATDTQSAVVRLTEDPCASERLTALAPENCK